MLCVNDAKAAPKSYNLDKIDFCSKPKNDFF